MAIYQHVLPDSLISANSNRPGCIQAINEHHAEVLAFVPKIGHGVFMPTPQHRDAGYPEIRAEMGRQRMTMLKLSVLTGFPRSTLIAQINGGSKMSVDVLVAVAAALDAEPGDFLPDHQSISA